MIGIPCISCPLWEFTFFQNRTRSIDFGSLFLVGRAARTIHAFLGCSAAFLTILLAKHVFAREACLYRKLVRIILLILVIKIFTEKLANPLQETRKCSVIRVFSCAAGHLAGHRVRSKQTVDFSAVSMMLVLNG